jgi:GntR family transcriptional repressor for pyruvate dehydrogenase complex
MADQYESSPRLYQNIADRIAKSIESGDFGVGARLPPERELADQYSVSRPTVREALIALEIAGLVEVRTGSGTYVCPNTRKKTSKKAKTIEDAGPSAFELISARRMIEPSIAAHAAINATKKDVAAISDALAGFEANWHGTHWEKLEADRAFHMSIAESTHNAFMIKFLEELWVGMFGPIFAVLSQRSKLTNRQAMTMGDHHTILNCIKRGDSAGAHAAMTAHLVHVELTLLEQKSSVLARKPPAF